MNLPRQGELVTVEASGYSQECTPCSSALADLVVRFEDS